MAAGCQGQHRRPAGGLPLTIRRRRSRWPDLLIKLALAGTAVLAVLAITSCGEAQRVSSRPYLAVAADVGLWLQGQRRGNETAFWYGSVEDTSSVEPTLGSGVAGVVRFQLALARASGDSSALQQGRLGADWLLEQVPTLVSQAGQSPRPGSLYGGLPGVAVVLVEAAEQLHDDRYRAGSLRLTDAVHDVAKEVPDGVEWNAYQDVLFGSAGTGLFLLWAERQLGHRESLDLARSVGQTLLARARSDSGGVNWSFRKDREIILPNFSHGAPGIGTFLLRLHQRTGEDRWLRAALDAARYLESIADTSDGGFLIPYSVPNGQFNYEWDIGWAHGPAGTARFYLLLAEVTGDSRWLDRVEGAVRSIEQSGIPGEPLPRYGAEPFKLDMRFGQASVAAFLIDWSQRQGGRAALELGRSLTDDILLRATRDSSGTRWTVPQYGFMPQPGSPATHTGYFYGAAGFGTLLLRLDAALAGREWRWRLPDDPF